MNASSKVRALLAAIGLCAMAAALGCPVYSDNSVVAVQCVYATDCPLGYRCTIDGFCVQAPPLGEAGAGMRADAGSDAQIDGSALDVEAGDGAPD